MEFFELSKKVVLGAVSGLKDCVVGTYKLKNVFNAQGVRESVQQDTSSISIKKNIMHCIIFGVCFWLSNYIFNELLNSIIAPQAKWFGQEDIWLLCQFLYLVFFSFWLFPMFFFSKLLNFLWYQDIADVIFVNTNIKKNIDYKISISLADQCKSFFLQTIFCVQGFAVYLLPLSPLLQNVWYLFHLALLCSLYAFEYKWVYMRMLLPRRIRNIEKKWPYYVGFGFLLAIITMGFQSFIDSMIVFAAVFPICIISSAYIPDEQIPLAPFPLPIFKFSNFASDVIISFFWNVLHARFTFFIR